ncbi:excisionase family DNA binding protein [Haloactinopolyspora alba]|uniref:Excisionase family DNA binding protein n=1 Tax=Haloactinopolyspora alba TaxID=648780 RepID=A0A2P8EFA3_9ACTN|nr:helix-turn-helix domain-containing protein [Haloactinopolyspora alba]PSL08155.1 excisionase family DNA binding protein [Haloactinopolyspora alba]
MDWIGVSEAARVLGVSETRVRKLLRQGALRGRRVSGVWLLDPASVEQRRREAPTVGQTVTPAHAWAVLAAATLLDRQEQSGLSGLLAAVPVAGSARQRLRENLSSAPDADGWSRWLAGRAVRRSYVLDRAGTYRLADDGRVSLGGPRGLARAGEMTSPVGDAIDVYVPEGSVDAVVAAHGLSEDAVGNLALRVVSASVPAALAPIPGRPAPAAACLVDLLDRPDTGDADSATDRLGQILERVRRLTGRGA